MDSHEMAARIVARFLEAKSQRIKVKNRDTGNIDWKTPEALKRSPHPERYQRLPQEPHRNPNGRPSRPEEPGKDTLPAPPKLPKPPKPPKLPKPEKLPKPVPPLKVPEPPNPAPKEPIPGQKWKREGK